MSPPSKAALQRHRNRPALRPRAHRPADRPGARIVRQHRRGGQRHLRQLAAAQCRGVAEAGDVAIRLQLAEPELQIADPIGAVAYKRLDPVFQLLDLAGQVHDLGFEPVHPVERRAGAQRHLGAAGGVELGAEPLQLDKEQGQFLADVGKRLRPVLGREAERGHRQPRGQDQGKETRFQRHVSTPPSACPGHPCASSDQPVSPPALSTVTARRFCR
ncbi:MAG: hypothetical protein R3D80_09790 [Paracoccaceae bacterium]